MKTDFEVVLLPPFRVELRSKGYGCLVTGVSGLSGVALAQLALQIPTLKRDPDRMSAIIRVQLRKHISHVTFYGVL